MAPFDLAPISGTFGYDLIFLVIGMGFGAILEMSGFGDSRKLAAQFYFREMTVLKVMFTAIITAAVLLAMASSLGLLDLDRVWVNPTFLAPGIVGGLIMGVGFIVGGFCPGTSVVAASTLKLDGVFFVLGVGLGVWAFGETVGGFEEFFHSTSMGRFTIPEWLGLPYGVVVVLLVLMALAMFWGAELSEAFFGARTPWKDIPRLPRSPALRIVAGALLGLAGVTAILGQPTVDDRWDRMAAEAGRRIEQREIYVDPAEVVDLRKDLSIRVVVLDLRSEADFNRFHIAGSRRLILEEIRDPAVVKRLPVGDDVVLILASNGEAEATAAWRDLVSQGVINLYILAGGINGWLDRYPPSPCVALRDPAFQGGEAPAWKFAMAVGERIPSAHPELPRKEIVRACGEPEPAVAQGHAGPPAPYVKKVRLQRKTVAKGGCG